MSVLEILVLFALSLLGVNGQVPKLKIAQGEIEGVSIKVEDEPDLRYSAFKGIPYAKAPVGELRLKEPEKHEGWSGNFAATQYGSECPQLDAQGRVIGREDCLFINVFTRNLPKGDTRLDRYYPVMVFLHGGNFQRGSSNPYGADRFIQNEVLIVTLNYRLGILGFLSTGDESCPGNLGLKDQVMALQWVNDNIQSFGGDKNTITIFGQDAGAASVFLHILSPLSKGLFHRAITQSGSPLCDWSVEEHPYSFAVEIANRLKCSTKSTWSMADCIRKKNVNEILDAQKDTKVFGDYPFRAIAVVDKNGFLPETPIKLLESTNSRIPLMSGVNKDDGTFFYPLVDSYREKLRNNASFLVTDLIPKFILTATDIRGNPEFVSKAVHFEYFNEIDPLNETPILQALVNMSTDAMFTSCNEKTVELYSSKGAPTYMYAFEYKGEHSMLLLDEKQPVNYDGVAHGDELMYLFHIDKVKLEISNDKRMGNQMVMLWKVFAETGKSMDKVEYDFPKWEPYTDKFKNYYKLLLRNELKTAYKQRAVNFWLNHIPSLASITSNTRLEYKTGDFGWAMFAIALILLVAVIVLGVIVYRKSKSQYFEARTDNK